jgi:hypothetical protein
MSVNSKRRWVWAMPAASLAVPAFGQAVSHTGSELPHYYNSADVESFGQWAPPSAASQAAGVVRADPRILRR